MMFYDLFMFILLSLLSVICVSISVAFLTLFECKVLSYIQIRKGSNKVGFVGIPQPSSDAIKLICKEESVPIVFNYLLYYFSPVFNLICLAVRVIFPYLTYMCSFSCFYLFFVLY